MTDTAESVPSDYTNIIKLLPVPLDYIEKTTGLTKEEAQQEYIEDFSTDFLRHFKRSSGQFRRGGDSLTLRTSVAKNMVLEKQ